MSIPKKQITVNTLKQMRSVDASDASPTVLSSAFPKQLPTITVTTAMLKDCPIVLMVEFIAVAML